MTTKNSKQEMFTEVERVLNNTKNLEKSWKERAKYALKAGLEKCTKSDLYHLLKEVESVTAPIPVENSSKPALKKTGTKKAESKATAEEPKTEKTTETKKKVVKKSANKVEEAAKLSSKSFSMAKIFPPTVEVKDLGELVARPDEFHSMADLVEAINNGREIYFATYWTARQIKEFNYSGACNVPCPKSFDNDLDILMAVVTCTNIDRVWCMSVYTEAMYNFDGTELEPVTDKDEAGNKYQIRVSNGMEFEIYEKVAE